jgi:hypothetical protein
MMVFGCLGEKNVSMSEQDGPQEYGDGMKTYFIFIFRL